MINSRFILASSIAVLLAVRPTAALAATITVNSATTSKKSLNDGDTLNVTSAGSITLSSTGNVVDIAGDATVNNSGTLWQKGSGRVTQSKADGTVFNITNSSTGIIEADNGDTIKISDLQLILNNSGQILNTANQALDLADVATVSNGAQITNNSTGLIKSISGDAIKTGAHATINNAGAILAIPNMVSGNDDTDYGINTDTNSGIVVNNTGSIKGRHGITGGVTSGTYTITVTNTGTGVIEAANGSGINIDGVLTTVTAHVTNGSGATIKGAVDTSTNGDGDGVDVDGVLTLDNSGDILGYGAKGVGSDGGTNHAEAVAAGGGTINNLADGRIIGSTLAADAPNGDTSRIGTGILMDNSSGGSAIAAATVTNSGLIQGKTGPGIHFIGTFADHITNNATGTIRGAGTGAAILTGDGGDTLDNLGAIIGDNGIAVDLEAGDDTLNITGGSASITGSVSGGTGNNTMTLNPGAGNSFSYSGVISNFNTVTVKSGTNTLSGANSYNGTTTISGGALAIGANAPSGSPGVLGNATSAVLLGDTTAGATGSASLLTMGAFTVARNLTVQASGSGGTQTISIGGSQTTGTSIYSGAISLNRSVTLTAATGGTVDFTGSIANASGTNTVSVAGGGTVKLTAASANQFAPTKIDVTSGGTLLLGGSEQIANATSMTLSGGKFQTGGFDETLGALTLTASSVIDMGSADSVLKFADSHSLSASWSGTLSIYDWTGNVTGGGTDEIFFGSAATGLTSSQLGDIRFFSGNGTGFLGTAGILGSGELVPVPEPATIWGALGMVGLIGYRERRRVSKLGGPASKNVRI